MSPPENSNGGTSAAAPSEPAPPAKPSSKGKKKDEKKDDDLSEEDQALKEQLELYVVRAQDVDPGVQRLALESMRQEIRSATSSMTSVPKPLKFLRPHYGTLKSYFDTMPESEVKKYMADILSVLALTMSVEGERVCAGNRKHMAMLERLSKRTATSSAESLEASPVAAFLSRFAAAKAAAESSLSACRSSPDDAPASLAAASAAVDDLECLVAEASHSLPPYELRSALAAVSDLRAAHKLAASEIRPKKSFSFRNKSKATKNTPQDPPAPLQPPPEQPKPSFDAILPGFGFRARNGATLVKDLRVANEKDGDFTLADLVSCEVYLKGKCRALYIHKLRDCRVFIGPVFGSVLIEDVERCTFVMAAHQIRIHEARATDFYLLVRSRPIIEDCNGVRFAPHALKYVGIEEDLKDSGLEEDTGNWANVDDFKWLRAVQSPNWCLVPRKSVCRL